MSAKAQLIQHIRVKLDDIVEPYLVSDADVIRALDVAQFQFAEQTFCLYDASSATVTTVAENPWVAVPDNVLRLRNLVRPTGEVVRPTTLAELEYGYARFEDNPLPTATWRALTGAPRFAVTDMEPTRLRLVPIPTAVETLQIEAFIAPPSLIPVDNEPAIGERWLHDLIYGALMQIYSMQDTELYSPEASEQYRQRWEQALTIAIETLGRKQRDITRRFRLPRTLERNTSILGATSPDSAAPNDAMRRQGRGAGG